MKILLNKTQVEAFKSKIEAVTAINNQLEALKKELEKEAINLNIMINMVYTDSTPIVGIKLEEDGLVLELEAVTEDVPNTEVKSTIRKKPIIQRKKR